MHTPSETEENSPESASVVLPSDERALLAEGTASADPIARVAGFLAAGDADEALRTILESWIGILTGPRSGELDALCRRLPASQAEDPRLLVVRACAQDALGANAVAQMLLGRARAVVRDAGDMPGLDWQLAFADMMLLDDRAQVKEASDRAWRLLSEGVSLDPRSRAAALHHMGWGYLRHRGEPERGIEILEFAVREAGAIGDDVLHRRAARHLAFTLAWAGRLRSAQRVLDGIEDGPDEYGPWRLNTYGDTAAAMGYIAYLTNDLELAQRSVADVASEEAPVVSFAGTARMMLLLTAAASQDGALIRRATLELQDVPANDARGISWEAFRHLCTAVLAEAAGDRDRALTIARRYADHDDLPLVAVVFAGILRRAGKTSEALRMLQRLERYRHFSYVRVATLTTAALVQAQEGKVRSAHELCERALGIAAREGVRRPFCEGEPKLRRLLTAHLSWGTHHETFISECLVGQLAPDRLRGLSQRERLVFARLRTAQTLPEVAEELGVSVNTIKTQLKSIYRKLGVSSRRDAVRLLLDEPA